MSESDKRSLQALAEQLVDGASIDWQRAQSAGSEEPDRLASLQLLDAVGKTFDVAGRAHQPPEQPILFRWGPLDVIEKLDEGSFGEVYRALDRELCRPVALKLRKETLPKELSDQQDSRWIIEAQRLAKLRHPNVLTVHGAGSHDGRSGLWTELLTGTNLRRQLDRDGPLDLDALLRVATSVSAAIGAIHQADMTHGDVKASNVVRELDGRVMLLDFGSGSDLDSPSSSAGSQGSPLTTAPEVLDGQRPQPTSDIYSLGAMLYLLAAGRPAIEAESYEDLRRRAAAGLRSPLDQLRPDLPNEFIAAVDRALEVDPSRRFQSADDLGQAIRSISTSISSSVSTLEPTVRTVNRSTLIALAAALILALTIALAFGWMSSPGDRPVPADQAALGGQSILGIQASLTRIGPPDLSLVDGARVSPGDRLELRVAVDQPTFLYLINEDEQGESFVLFPLPGLEPQNPLPAGSHRLPGAIAGRHQSWVVTSTGGSERFLIIASDRQIPTVVAFFEHIEKAGEGAVGGRTDGSSETTRGVAGLVPSDSKISSGLESLRAVLEADPRDIWLEWIYLENPL